MLNEKITSAEWLSKLPRYPFVSLREKKKALKAKGIKVIDFSIGDPTAPTPDFILESATEGMKKNQRAGYPENSGLPEFKSAVVKWMKSRFDVDLNPDTENKILECFFTSSSVMTSLLAL